MGTLKHTLFFFLLITQICLAQWVQVGLGDKTVKDIAARNANIFVITSDSGSVYRSTDNGTNWTLIIDVGAVDIAMGSNGFLFVVKDDSLFRSSDNGNLWLYLNVVEQILPGYTYTWPVNISMSPNGVAFCGIIESFGGRGSMTWVALSTDGGLTWSSPGLNVLGGWLFGFRDHSVITVGWSICEPYWYSTLSQVSFDDGQTWFIHSIPPISFNLFEIPPTILSFCLNGIVFLGGGVDGWSGSGIYISTDSCNIWTQVSYIIPQCGLSLPFGGMLAGTDSSGVFLFSDNGDSLGSRNDGLTNLNIRTLTIDNNNYVYAGTENGIWRRPLSEITSVEEEVIHEIPTEFLLSQNYPNPFNPSTSIQYAVSSRQFVSLKVYDILGNEIETLVNEEKPASTYEITWHAANLPSGVYFYQLKAGSFIETKKMLLIK